MPQKSIANLAYAKFDEPPEPGCYASVLHVVYDPTITESAKKWEDFLPAIRGAFRLFTHTKEGRHGETVLDDVFAEDGYGPPIFRLAMEISGGLRPRDSENSEECCEVYRQFYQGKGKDDVIIKPSPIQYWDDNMPWMDVVYCVKSPVVVNRSHDADLHWLYRAAYERLDKALRNIYG